MRKKQNPYDFTHVWARKQKVASEQHKQKQTQDIDDSMVLPGGAGGEEGKVGKGGQIYGNRRKRDSGTSHAIEYTDVK